MTFARSQVLWSWIWLGLLVGAQAQGPVATFEIGANERVVHLVGAPFTDSAYEPRLEALLLGNFARHGLKYRRVPGYLAQYLEDLEGRIFAHRPTLVLIQTGNWDLVRQRHFDFSTYPNEVERLVAQLVQRRIRVILCSPVPVGGSRRDSLIFPTDGLARWTEAARQTAARHGIAFVDLFTDAIEWPMPGAGKASYHYGAAEHKKSFDLFCRQLRFVPAGSLGNGSLPAYAIDGRNFAALKKELDRGQTLAANLAGIRSFALPDWVKVADFAPQQKAALEAASRELENHDARIAALVGKN